MSKKNRNQGRSNNLQDPRMAMMMDATEDFFLVKNESNRRQNKFKNKERGKREDYSW